MTGFFNRILGAGDTVRPESADAVSLRRFHHLDRLIAACNGLPALRVAVVAPEERSALAGPVQAAQAGLIDPVLVGDPAKMNAAAAEIGADISGFEVIAESDHDAAAARSVALVHEGQVGAVMKGYIHTGELLRHVVKREGGLRTTTRISHAFVMDVPGLNRPLLITDAAISIAPGLEEKIDITRNAIELARALGIATPKVAIMSAVESVNPGMQSSVDAGEIAKLAKGGGFEGGIVDGPFAMDNAMDLEAARTKGITSPVAGHADVLVMPTIEAGNMLYKALVFLASSGTAGLVLGARVPVILTSRADDDMARLASCAVAVLHRHWQEHGKSAVA